MIKEVTDMQHFERLARQWNSPENELFWTTQSCSQGRQFYPKRIESNFRSLLHHSIQHEGIMPFIKMWSYEENDISLGGCVFLVDKNMMMQETLLEELLWQCPGRYPHSIKDKKILLSLLDCVEDYGRKNKISTMKITRDPRLHRFTKEKNSGVKNSYTRSGYEATGILYTKRII